MFKKVLYVEDSALDAKIIQELLDKEGIENDIAASGEEGFRKSLEMKPQLILLDLVLHDISGFEVCSKIKAEVSLSNTIIVVLSIKDKLEDITKSFSVGADDYIIKPSMPEFLVRKIKLYLGIKK